MTAEVVDQVDIDGGVVVGDDGSTAAREALRWAAEEAELRGQVLHVVRAWMLTHATRPKSWTPGYVPSLEEFETACREDVVASTEQALGSRPHLKLQVHVVHGAATRVLIDASQRADLLVVGHRGAGGFRGLLLGSTAHQCVHHAACPVVVIRSGLSAGREHPGGNVVTM
jgi:nucleotide-binding universal stress UspA family protein